MKQSSVRAFAVMNAASFFYGMHTRCDLVVVVAAIGLAGWMLSEIMHGMGVQ